MSKEQSEKMTQIAEAAAKAFGGDVGFFMLVFNEKEKSTQTMCVTNCSPAYIEEALADYLLVLSQFRDKDKNEFKMPTKQ